MDTQTLLIDLLILAIFGAAVYSFLIMPRRREYKQRQQFVATLQPGTRVTTYGGMLGTVTRIDRRLNIVTLEIAPGIEVDFLGPAIVNEYDEAEIEESVRKALGDSLGDASEDSEG